MTTTLLRAAHICALSAALLLTSAASAGAHGRQSWEVDDLLTDAECLPFAIAHRGFGANLGEDPDRPIENSVRAMRAGFRAGAHIAELDVQLDGFGRAYVLHDDPIFEEDGSLSCLAERNRRELRREFPQARRLRHVLRRLRPFTRARRGPSGIVIVEVKAPSPLCDPQDANELELMEAVVSDIRAARMEDSVLIESFSPALVALAASLAPEIDRVLSVSALQFLSDAEVEAVTGLPVVEIDKDPDFGLRWGNIGPLFRLPGYESPAQYLGVALGLGARAVSLDKLLLGQAEQTQPGSGAALVATAQMLGLTVFGFTAVDDAEFLFLQSLGVDGIFTDDVPGGVALQGDCTRRRPRPRHRHRGDRDDDSDSDSDSH